MAEEPAATVRLRHLASGTVMEVGKTGFDAGEFPKDEYEVLKDEPSEPRVEEEPASKPRASKTKPSP